MIDINLSEFELKSDQQETYPGQLEEKLKRLGFQKGA